MLMDEAASLMMEYPDSAYLILQSISSSSFPQGSELEARYALLYTQAQYKCYADIPGDSLISVAVDYYEARGSRQEKFYAYLYQGIVRFINEELSKSSMSLAKAMMNSDEVSDCYSKGQMMMCLAYINERLRCKDEEYYARLASIEYKKGGLESYYLNAMTKVAEAKIRKSDYAACRYLLDSLSPLAIELQDTTAICELLRLKAYNAIFEDSLSLAESVYTQLINVYDVSLNSQEYGNLAVISSAKKSDSYLRNLKKAEELRHSKNDTISYWVKSLFVARNLCDQEAIIACQDSLLYYSEELLSEYQEHNTIEAEREYSDCQLKYTEEKLFYSHVALGLSLLCILLILLYSVEIYRRKLVIIQSQADKIKLLQMEQRILSAERQRALQIMKKNELVLTIKHDSYRTTGLKISEWKCLEKLFAENLPNFELSLRKVVDISELELKVCFLLKLGFTPGQIAILVDHSQSSISLIRSRLYKKAFRKKGKSVDWDSFIDTI